MHKTLQNSKMDATKCFGGTRVILFGDFKQLGPFTTSEREGAEFFLDDENYQDGKYCFDTKLWRDLDLVVVRLSHNFRQETDDGY